MVFVAATPDQHSIQWFTAFAPSIVSMSSSAISQNNAANDIDKIDPVTVAVSDREPRRYDN